MVSTGTNPFTGSQLTARVMALIGLIALANWMVFAQGFAAAITGTVKDTSGAAVPGAAVTVKHLETGLTRAVAADASGNYSILSLPVGAYELVAEKMGFQQEVRRGINLVVAQEAVVDFTLQVGSIVQQVTVTEAAPLVNTTTVSTSGLISEQQIKELPLNGRSFDQLLTLNVGMANNTANTLNNSAWTAFSVAGKRPETNRFLINGVDYIGGNASGLFITPSGASGMLLGVDAVREYNVLPNSYGAEYGKRAGGQISIVTSSGTNQLHGDLFEYLRNSAFDARNFFDATSAAPPFKRNQFGASLGGPLKKDKLFLFGNYEGFRQRLAVSSVAVVPGSNARLGFLPNGTSAGVKQAMVAYANAFWPAPTGPDFADGTANSVTNPPQSVREDFGLARFDYTISRADTFSANYTIDNGFRSVPQVDPIFIQLSDIHSQTVSLQETHIFSPRLVNVATVGFTRAYAAQVNSAPSIPSNLAFLPGGNPGSIIIGGGVITAQPSQVAAASGNNPYFGARNHFTYADDVHFTRGSHAWSVGVWTHRVQENLAGAAQGSAGNVAYQNVTKFLLDQPTAAILVRNPVPVGYRSWEGAWYVQDEIALRRNLNLRLGLRDEFTDGWNEAFGRCTNYFYDPGFVIQTNPNIGNSCFQKNNAKLLLQPRVGLAWDPTGGGAWSVRAGFGIHNDLLDNLGIRAYPNPPFNAREQISITNGWLPYLPFQKNAPLPPTCNAQSPLRPPACSIYQPAGFDPAMFTPTIQEWSLTVERQITRDLMIAVGYVGSESYHTNITMDSNAAPPQLCQNAAGCASGGTTASGAAYCPSKTTPVCPIVPLGTTYMAPGTRPNPFVSNSIAWFDEGTANYNALDVSLQKRSTRGLSFKLNYTYSKVLDLNSAILAPGGENEPPDVFSPYNLGLNRGPASYSLEHQFNGNFSYQLPFGSGRHFASGSRGLVNQVIGGWQWNGIVTAQGGFPFTPLVGSNISGTGDTNPVDVPNWNPNFSGPVLLRNPNQWFNPNAFQMPIAGTFGNVSRGFLRGPGLVDVDTSFFKRFQISEQWTLQFRAELFNILNQASFAYPNGIVFAGNKISSTAGQITATSTTSRQIQFALKLMF
ncbi:MAG: TonB-dependent receptor [Acidobacteria bacterium]|nr:MAG: TonB-dependent receptor [Acidobacteriota bacterium]